MKVQEKLKKYRGKQYGKAVREAWEEYSGKLKESANEIIEKTEKFTPVDIFNLSQKYDLSFKLTSEYLEELQVIPTGTYDQKLKRLKVSTLRLKSTIERHRTAYKYCPDCGRKRGRFQRVSTNVLDWVMLFFKCDKCGHIFSIEIEPENVKKICLTKLINKFNKDEKN